MRSLRDSNITNKIVLVRLDLDLKDKELVNLDHPRLVRVIPTLRYLLERQNKVLIIAHRGRPEGHDLGLSLRIFKDIFSQLLSQKVAFCSSFQKMEMEGLFKDNKLVILENLRFDPGEEENSSEFSSLLASFAEVYVFEAFGMSHRDHASVVGIPKYLKTYAGLNFEKEVEVLGQVKNNPQRPLVAIIGGAKIETKEEVIGSFLKLADKVLIGGKLIETRQPQSSKVVEPSDVWVATKTGDTWEKETIQDYRPLENGSEKNIVDIGTKTIEAFKEVIKSAKTVVWNGPMGVYEDTRFSLGTKEIGQAITNSSAFKVVGGGETLSFVLENNLVDRFDHVSLGGGAMLEFFAKDTLPALEALEWKN